MLSVFELIYNGGDFYLRPIFLKEKIMSIKLNSFINVFKTKKNDEEKLELVKKHINNEYIPYEHKVAVAQTIIDNSFWKKEVLSDGTETKVLHIDSVVKYMMFCMCVIDLFTDIERNKKSMLEDFNTLNSFRIFDLIIQCVNQRELDEFNMILDFLSKDTIQNEFEIHSYITKQVSRFADLFGSAILPALENLDLDKLNDVIKEKMN